MLAGTKSIIEMLKIAQTQSTSDKDKNNIQKGIDALDELEIVDGMPLSEQKVKITEIMDRFKENMKGN